VRGRGNVRDGGQQLRLQRLREAAQQHGAGAKAFLRGLFLIGVEQISHARQACAFRLPAGPPGRGAG
jgi:hypothetical protein